MAAVAAAAPRSQLSPLSGGGGAAVSSLSLQTPAFISPLPTRRRRRCVLRSNASSSPSPPPSQEKEAAAAAVEVVPTAESCVNLGLQLFSKGRVKDALEQFENALELNPTPIEAQAALYNKACCHAYREESKKAAECLREALRDYNLKFGTILNDPDCNRTEAWSAFPALKILKLKDLQSFHGWEAITATQGHQIMFPHLEKLSIRSCQELIALVIRYCGSLVEVFNVPTSLKTMKVWKCPKVESIFGKQQDRSAFNQGPSTDVMASTAEPQLSSMTRDHFLPCLESLTIWECGSLSEVVNLPPSLREIDIWECDKLQVLSGQLDALRTLKIFKCPLLRSLESGSEELQMLERLDLHHCESLASFLPSGPQAYSSLSKLTIRDCPGIKSLPSSLRQQLDNIDDDDKFLDVRYEGAKLLKPKTWKYASCSN